MIVKRKREIKKLAWLLLIGNKSNTKAGSITREKEEKKS
jgi:hypothetical protein